jgi:hypothetical protein
MVQIGWLGASGADLGIKLSKCGRHRRSCPRRRAEMFTWQRTAAGVLTTLSAAAAVSLPGRFAHHH